MFEKFEKFERFERFERAPVAAANLDETIKHNKT
jgi:hypothetical protein